MVAWVVFGSGGESGLMGEVVEGDLVGAGRLAERGRLGWTRVAGLSEAGSEQVVVGVGEQQRVLQPGVGDTVRRLRGMRSMSRWARRRRRS